MHDPYAKTVYMPDLFNKHDPAAEWQSLKGRFPKAEILVVRNGDNYATFLRHAVLAAHVLDLRTRGDELLLPAWCIYQALEKLSCEYTVAVSDQDGTRYWPSDWDVSAGRAAGLGDWELEMDRAGYSNESDEGTHDSN